MDNDELKNLCDKLSGLDPDWQPDNHQEILENSFKENKKKQNHIILYDPIKKEKRNYKECRRSYGKVFSDKLLYAKENNKGQLEKDDYIKSMKEYNNEIPQHVGINFSVIDNPEIWERIYKYIGMYLYIRRRIVRGVLTHDKLNIYENYYKKGYLACAVTKRQLGKINGISKNTAATHIEKLVKLGAIEIESNNKMLKRNTKGSYMSECDIYLLGSIEKGKEHFFVDML